MSSIGASPSELQLFRSAWEQGDLFNLHGILNAILSRRRPRQ